MYRLLCLLSALFLLPLASAAPPTEYVARGVAWYKCAQTGGSTNTSSSGSGTDIAHTLTCAIDANTIKAGTVVKACATVSVVTGTAAPTLLLKLKAGSTTLYAPGAPLSPQNSVTRNSGFCWTTIGGAAPGAAAATYTALEGFPTEMYYTDQSNVTAQPVSLGTNGALTLGMTSQWGSVGSGSNSATLQAFTVTITN